MNPPVDVLNEFGRWLAGHLLPISMEWAVLTIVVLIALATLRPKSPTVRHLLWCLVLLKPLTTIIVASPVSFYGLLKLQPPARAPVAVTAEAAVDGRLGPVDAELMTKRRPHAWRYVMVEQPEVRPEATLNRYGIAAVIYLLAAAALSLRLLVGFAYVSFLRTSAHVQRDGPLVDLLAHALDRMGMRGRVALAVSNVTHGPVLAGIVRPTILLPEHLTSTLSPRQLEYIITHELTHVRRWDNLLLAVQRVVEIALFFHPAIWLCGRALRREAEAACDEQVLCRLGGAADYADSLTRVAETRDRLTRRLLVNTFAAAESDLAARVRRILRGPVGRLASGRSIATIIILVVIACLGLPTSKARSAKRTGSHEPDTTTGLGDTAMSDRLEYGFRHDPLEFVKNDESLEAAVVRTFVFGEPRLGDDQLIKDELTQLKVFEPRGDGDSGKCGGPPYNFNAENMLRLVLLGATKEHPELQRALSLLEMIPERPKEPITGDPLHALCLLGQADRPAIHHSLQTEIGSADKWIRPLSGCPWTPSGSLPGLWAARELEDTAPLVERGLRGIRDEIGATGCLSFMDPWSFVHCAAHIDHPIAREILIKQVPMLLRAQRPDGGWGENTFKVFAALKKHGLLDELRSKPPLPSDWKVVRSIPAPSGDLWGFVWDGERLWTGQRTTNEALALSPQDGRVVNRVKLPAGHGRWLGWWDGKLAVTQGGPPNGNPKRLLQIDPGNGRVVQKVPLDKLEHVGGATQVGDELWVFDAFFGSRYVLDPAKPRSPRQTHDESDLPCALPITLNAAGESGVWLVDAWSPWIIKTDRSGRLLDWAERPFAGYEGVVWDGEQLWAIDEADQRICAIEKTDTAPRP